MRTARAHVDYARIQGLRSEGRTIGEVMELMQCSRQKVWRAARWAASGDVTSPLIGRGKRVREAGARRPLAARSATLGGFPDPRGMAEDYGDVLAALRGMAGHTIGREGRTMNHAMVVYREGGGVRVTSGSAGRGSYAVDLEHGRCECPASRFQHRGCKHLATASAYFQRLAVLNEGRTA